jgi:hypothetical protein
MRLASLSLLMLIFVLTASTGISAAQDTNFPVGPQYLLTGSPVLARPIVPPTHSLDAEPQNQPDLLPIYYGYPMPSVIELVSTEPKELPPSIVDTGVGGMTNVQSLRERGYGVTLGQTASFWKSHAPHATRVYTNADIERLHGS